MGFTQPRVHLIVHPCMYNKLLQTLLLCEMPRYGASSPVPLLIYLGLGQYHAGGARNQRRYKNLIHVCCLTHLTTMLMLLITLPIICSQLTFQF